MLGGAPWLGSIRRVEERRELISDAAMHAKKKKILNYIVTTVLASIGYNI